MSLHSVKVHRHWLEQTLVPMTANGWDTWAACARHPGQPAARVPLPPDLEEEAVRSAAYESPSSSSTSSSSSEEELLPDTSARKRKAAEELKREREKDAMVIAYSIEVTPKDFKRILKKLKRSGIWLSQKMAEKSKEVSWQRLIQEEKVEFDEAQAVELNNVLTSAAVRALSQSEHKGLDYNKVMRMRWVLTRKNSGAAKARLPHYCSDGGRLP